MSNLRRRGGKASAADDDGSKEPKGSVDSLVKEQSEDLDENLDGEFHDSEGDSNEDGDEFDDDNLIDDDGEKLSGRALVAEVKAQRDKEMRDLALERESRDGAPSFRERLGITVQRPEVQVIMLILIVVDVAAALVQMFMAAGILPGQRNPSMVHIGKFLEYQSAVTIMVFILEMIVALISFGFMILSHPGYTLDLGIVMVQVYLSAVYESTAVRLLGVVRMWRLLRLVDKILEDERDAHAYSLEKLDDERSRVDDLLAQLREKDHVLKRERERLNRANEMLRNYKDDNAWLVDALHIAAESAATGLAAGGPGGVSLPVPMPGAAGLESLSARSGSSGSGVGASGPKKGIRKRAKIKIGADGVQRIVRE